MRKLTLSFDNGPDTEYTPAIVDLLNEQGVRGSFFVVGQNIAAPGAHAALEKAHESGHWICNHTYSHGDPLGWGDDAARAADEISRAESAIGLWSHPRKFFRPNGAGQLGRHLLNRAAVRYLTDNRFTVVTWNNVPEDWVEPRAEWVDRALETMRTQAWSLVVIHDFLIGPMLPTLARFIEDVRTSGVEIVQDFPPDCVHMECGLALPSLETVTTLS
ncbi:MAG TPA: polysaccharide deacetylase family protein [Sphingomonadaceae bacterium]|nr:polysaccharide deacetylase family protein [Sphingomonadaceae bacterium]